MPSHPDTPERLIGIERAVGEREWPEMERREAPAANEIELELIHRARPDRVDPRARPHRRRRRGRRHLRRRGLLPGRPARRRRRLRDDAGAAGRRGQDRVLRAAPLRPPRRTGAGDGLLPLQQRRDRRRAGGRELGAERVFVLDWDVHHGNGTAEAFRRRDDVLFVSIHQAGIYPGTRPAPRTSAPARARATRSTCRFPPAADEEIWLSLLEHIVLPVATSVRPRPRPRLGRLRRPPRRPARRLPARGDILRRDGPPRPRRSPSGSGAARASCSRAATNRPPWPTRSLRPSPRSAAMERRPRSPPTPCSPPGPPPGSPATGICEERWPARSSPRSPPTRLSATGTSSARTTPRSQPLPSGPAAYSRDGRSGTSTRPSTGAGSPRCSAPFSPTYEGPGSTPAGWS